MHLKLVAFDELLPQLPLFYIGPEPPEVGPRPLGMVILVIDLALNDQLFHVGWFPPSAVGELITVSASFDGPTTRLKFEQMWMAGAVVWLLHCRHVGLTS